MERDSLLALAAEAEKKRGAELEEINHFMFGHPELGMEEYVSAQYLADYMEKNGFKVTKPCAGLETAFRAEYGDDDGPVVAFMAEYDALPGYGPEKKPAHACGHNWIAATCAGAAVVLKDMKEHFKGKIVLMGTPAEENLSGKAIMVNEGVFDGVDAAMQMHLCKKTALVNGLLAITTLDLHFKGRAAHASGAPFNGINALDAVQLTFAGINALRQHVKSDVRIHGIVTEGGMAPNIVPDSASCLFYVRAEESAYRDEVVEKVLNCAKGAALMTGAELTVTVPAPPLDNYLMVPSLVELCRDHLEANGIPVGPLVRDKAPEIGSSDIGNVSYVCPTVYAEVNLAPGFCYDCHEEEFLAEMDGPLAKKRLHENVLVMAGMALDLYTDPALLERVRSEFRAAGK